MASKKNAAWPTLYVKSHFELLTFRNVYSVQFSSVTQSCLTLCNHMNHSMPGLPVHQLPEFTQTHVHWVGDAIQASHPLLSLSTPAPNPSQHQGFPMSQLFAWGGQSTGVSALAIIPSKEHPGLISFKMGWLDLLALQGTLKSLLQHYSSKASILLLSFLYSQTPTSTCDYWKSHSFD